MPDPIEIFLARDTQTRGPYTPDQIRFLLNDGSIDDTCLAWHEGLDNWKPVSQLRLNSQSSAPQSQSDVRWTQRPLRELLSFSILVFVAGILLLFFSIGIQAYVVASIAILLIVGGMIGYLIEKRWWGSAVVVTIIALFLALFVWWAVSSYP